MPVIARGLSEKWPLSAPVLTNLGTNVVAKHSVSQSGPANCRPPPPGTRRGVSGSPKIAIEAIATQSNRGDRELSSATLWHRHVYYRPVRGPVCGVRDSSIIGAASKRHGTWI